MVLLKNEGGMLPLDRGLGKIAVIGPNADDVGVLLGNYNGIPSDPVTPLRGIREAVSSRTEVIHAPGYQPCREYAGSSRDTRCKQLFTSKTQQARTVSQPELFLQSRRCRDSRCPPGWIEPCRFGSLGRDGD